MSNESALQMIVSIFSILGIIWRMAGVKADVVAEIKKVETSLTAKITKAGNHLSGKISENKEQAYRDTDSLKDSIERQLTSLDKRVDLFVQDSLAARERITYQLDGQGSRLGNEVEGLKKRVSGTIVFERLENKIDKVLDEIKKER